VASDELKSKADKLFENGKKKYEEGRVRSL